MVLDRSKKPCLTLSAGKRRARRHQLCTGGEVKITHSQPPRGNILNTAQGHVVGAGKAGNFGQAGHVAVIHGQLTQHAAGLKASHAHEVNRGLGVAAPLKHATGPRP